MRVREASRGWYLVLVVFALLDWGAFNSSVLDFHPRSAASSTQDQVAELLASQPGLFRIYSPSYSLPQHVAIDHGLELADGVDPLVLKSYADYMRAATGVPGSGYSVTIPTFETGDPKRDNASYQPDARLLGLLNVRYVAAAYDLEVDGLTLDTQIGETRIYKNQEARPRVWIQPTDMAIGSGVTTIESIDWRPNQIDLEVEGPGLVVLSEITYPGWRVRVDDQEAEILTLEGILRGVEVQAGTHKVRFSYVPVSVYYGLGAFCLGMMIIGGYGTWFKRKGDLG
jgi:hypothetical protein